MKKSNLSSVALAKDENITKQDLAQAMGELKNYTDNGFKDILQAINQFSSHMDNRFDDLEGRVGYLEQEFTDFKQEFGGFKQEFGGFKQEFGGFKQEFGGFKQEFGGFKQEFGGFKQEFNQFKTSVVTKDYLDEKLTDLRGDLIIMIRKEDNKLLQVVEKLEKKKIFSLQDSKNIMAMEPFAKT